MRALTLFTLLLLRASSLAQGVPGTRNFSLPCEELRPKAAAFLEERHWKPELARTCSSCTLASTNALRDADGHHFFSRGGIVRAYTTRTVQPKPAGPAWMVHSPIHVAAKLTYKPAAGGCKAALSFAYSWYGAELILGLPVDGDMDSAPSNGRLEAEYLNHLSLLVQRSGASPLHSQPIAQPLAAPLPDPTMPDSPATQIAIAESRGVQIYRCQEQTGIFAWILQAPEATLFVPGTTQQLGTHSAGPSWTWADGSRLTGKVLQKRASGDPSSIPWLLLETHSTAAIQGTLSAVTLVRRSNTEGGNPPPQACDVQLRETTIRVPYRATYRFYTTASR